MNDALSVSFAVGLTYVRLDTSFDNTLMWRTFGGGNVGRDVGFPGAADGRNVGVDECCVVVGPDVGARVGSATVGEKVGGRSKEGTSVGPSVNTSVGGAVDAKDGSADGV